jgi:hypothetical protein
LEVPGLTISARFSLITAFALVATAGFAPATAAAGTAYDSVTRFSQADNQPPPAPGSFSADFAQASTPPPPAPHLPFGLGKMAAAGQAAASMFTHGLAEKHYIGTTKERTDNVALNTADITDCVARTITHLDLAAKTYTVTSLDQSQSQVPTGGGHSAPGPAATDDGSKLAIQMTTRVLGPMKIEGVPTTGYAMAMKVTTTKPNGETQTFNTNLTAYYSGVPEPRFSCTSIGIAGSGGLAAASMMQYKLIMSALAARKGDSRFTVTTSGPSIPAGQMSMWDLMTLAGGADTAGRGGSFSVETERGGLHSIGDNDPIFSIPAGFTKS